MYYHNNNNGLIDRFCAKHPGFGIQNLMLYIVGGQVVVFLLKLFFPDVYQMFDLVGAQVLRGQVWRLVTFVFLPSSSNPFFLLLSGYFYYWIGQLLEREWGSTKFTLFYLSGVVLSIAYGLAFGIASIYYVNLSIFLIIATLYGEMQVLLFFVVPIKMKWLAILDVVLILADAVPIARMGWWAGALAPLPSFVNYFIFTWPVWSYKLGIARRKTDPKVIHFKRAARQAEKKGRETGSYLHKCAVCGVTDAMEPDMEFRYCSKCDGYYCYCANHINNHVHIRQD